MSSHIVSSSSSKRIKKKTFSLKSKNDSILKKISDKAQVLYRVKVRICGQFILPEEVFDFNQELIRKYLVSTQLNIPSTVKPKYLMKIYEFGFRLEDSKLLTNASAHIFSFDQVVTVFAFVDLKTTLVLGMFAEGGVRRSVLFIEFEKESLLEETAKLIGQYKRKQSTESEIPTDFHGNKITSSEGLKNWQLKAPDEIGVNQDKVIETQERISQLELDDGVYNESFDDNEIQIKANVFDAPFENRPIPTPLIEFESGDDTNSLYAHVSNNRGRSIDEITPNVQSMNDVTHNFVELIDNAKQNPKNIIESVADIHVQPIEISAHNYIQKNENLAHSHSQEIEISAFNHVHPIEISEDNQVQQIEISASNHVQPIENSAHNLVQPIENSAHNFVQPIENSADNHVQPIENSAHNLVQPIEISADNHVQLIEISADNHVQPIEISADNNVHSIEISADNQVQPIKNLTHNHVQLNESIVNFQVKPIEISANSLVQPFNGSMNIHVQAIENSTSKYNYVQPNEYNHVQSVKDLVNNHVRIVENLKHSQTDYHDGSIENIAQGNNNNKLTAHKNVLIANDVIFEDMSDINLQEKFQITYDLHSLENETSTSRKTITTNAVIERSMSSESAFNTVDCVILDESVKNENTSIASGVNNHVAHVWRGSFNVKNEQDFSIRNMYNLNMSGEQRKFFRTVPYLPEPVDSKIKPSTMSHQPTKRIISNKPSYYVAKDSRKDYHNEHAPHINNEYCVICHPSKKTSSKGYVVRPIDRV